MTSTPPSSKLGRTGFFGDRSSQFRGECDPDGLTGDVPCPSACLTAVSFTTPGGLAGPCEIVDVGESGPMFVTNRGPIWPTGIGEPGGSGASRRACTSKNPGVECDACADSEGALKRARSGDSLVSRECAVVDPEPYCECLGVSVAPSVVNDANGSSPMSDAVLSRTEPPPLRKEVGGPRPPPLPLGPMTSSTIRLRSTALDAFTSGSTSALGCPGGGQTASRKIEPDSARTPMRCGAAAPGGRLLGVPARYGSIGVPVMDGPGEASWKSRESGERPGTGLGLVCVAERECVWEETETG